MSPRSRDSRNEVKKGFDQDRINETIKFLEDAGFLKDEVVARELFRNALEGKHLGRKGIEMHLYRRGIGRELISKSLSGLTREMEDEAALKLVEKKLRAFHNKPAKVVKRRLWGMLQRRGFSGEIIRKAIETIEELS
jgi:regulatory protein